MANFTLLEEAKNRKNSFFIQFGGQGAPWYKELANYYAEERMKKFFDVVITAIEKTVAKVRGSVALPDGLPLRKWLDDSDSLASDETTSIAAVSMPMIEITQFAHYENLNTQGFEVSELLKYSKGTSGHSQGLITASFAALDLKGDEYYDALGLYVEYLFLQGVRAQEVYTKVFAGDAEKSKGEELGIKNPAPMVAVLGADHGFIEALVDDFNSAINNDSEKVYVSLYNSLSNRIISGDRSRLIAFYEKNCAALTEKEIKFVFLRTSCPFHCDLMLPIKEPFSKDVEKIGFNFKGSDLKIPLYSFHDGRNMQEDIELGNAMCEELMIKTLHWNKSLEPVKADSSITHVIDFGPGKTSQRLSLDTLKGMGCETPVLSVANSKDLKVILHSV